MKEEDADEDFSPCVPCAFLLCDACPDGLLSRLDGGTVRWHWTSKINPFVWVLLWTREIAITNRRLIYKRRWIDRRTGEMNLRRVEDVNLEQGAWGRIFGWGRLRMHGTGASFMHTPGIGRPGRFKKELQEAQIRSEQ